MIPDIFETVMLVCFGAAWPVSIVKMLRTKRSSGKSLAFLWIIFVGYICGIFFEAFGERNALICLYALNALMVLTDCILTFHYRKPPLPAAESADATDRGA